MGLWLEDLTVCSTEEIHRAQEENRRWSKSLRTQLAELVNRRLAKQITSEEYSTKRRDVAEEEHECRRRTEKLNREVGIRSRYQPSR